MALKNTQQVTVEFSVANLKFVMIGPCEGIFLFMNLTALRWEMVSPDMELRLGVQHILRSFDFTMIRRRVERGRYLWEANKVWFIATESY